MALLAFCWALFYSSDNFAWGEGLRPLLVAIGKDIE